MACLNSNLSNDSSMSADALPILKSALSYGDEKGFCALFESYDTHTLGECLLRDPTLFIQICGRGFSSAAFFFLRNCGNHVDLSAEFEERTALQWACLRGHLDIVERLIEIYLERGLTLQTEAWREHSEFYSASLGGHVDVMRWLMVTFLDSVRDEDVRQALLYAACVGGHMPMVRMWVRPTMDVNQPLRLVESLHDCEHRTPFQAACEGHHKEVADLLMQEFKAEITEHLADKFPEFTGKLVDSVYHPLQVMDDQVSYTLASVSTHAVHPSWIHSHLTVITDMDLSGNQLRRLPPCLPWAMTGLVRLNLSHNRLRSFPGPQGQDEILCDSLEKVDATYNSIAEVCTELFQRPSLIVLDLSHNALKRLKKTQLSPSHSEMSRLRWSCESLTTLNLSHNCLEVLPADDLKACTSMTTLDISHNQLVCLPPPWDCKLEKLIASHNLLERFPPSTEQYWSGSLALLFLQHNFLDQLTEDVFKLGMLQRLNASHNHIQHLAPAHVWDCPSLEDLNLSHNFLGQRQRENPKEAPRVVEFPSDLLSEELRSLNLSNNKLTHLPVSVCCIKNLALLDISNNPIKELPWEMGNLLQCWDLKLTGLSLQKADQQELVKNVRPVEVIEHLRKKLRKVQSCHILKVLVIGPENKGKSTVIESLVRANPSEVKLSQQYVTVTSATLKSPGSMKINERADNDRPNISLQIWELAGNPQLVAMHPLLWSENSLFLLVWDMTQGITGLSQWLSSIRSRLDRVNVLLVATFRDRLSAGEVDSRVRQFHKDVNRLYGDSEHSAGLYPKEDEQRIYPHLCSVVFVTRHMLREDIAELRKAVYRAALSLVKIIRPLEFVVGQKLPQSYLVIEKKLKKMAAQFKQEGRPPFLTQQEFDDLVRSDPAADFHMFEDQLEEQDAKVSNSKALKVWIQMGSVLHYDVWAEGLGQLYFLDPNWLAAMAASVLMPGCGVAAAYRQSLGDVQRRLVQAGYPASIFKPFLQLLKYFDIGTPLNDQESLLLPCLLARSAPGLQLSSSTGCRKLLRFYVMPHIPSRLWARLILGFLMSMDRFSQSCWQGQEMPKPHLTYWQEGLTIKYGGGSIVIESAVFLSTEDSARRSGILITILTDSSTLGDMAVIGFVTDQIDSALQTIFPHYMDNTSLFGIYALCPVCFHEVEPCTGVIRGTHLHFPLADCAGDLLHSDFAQCTRGNRVALEDLIPEFLMGELPKKFHLNSDVVRLEEKLGGGAAGTVYKGKLFGDAVAIKEFFRNVEATPFVQAEDHLTTDSGTSTMSSTASGTSSTDLEYGNFREVSSQVQQKKMDDLTGRNLKICRAFSELRQEIVILSQLRHPCLISLLGVSIRPSLLVVLELAPFGSLHSVLDNHMKDRPFNKYRDRDCTFSPVLNKDLTFKVVYQVALGLEYLHGCRIVYRDLKSDNILVCSLRVQDGVNVKISDYGISKFTTSQGMLGMVGTPGYMAPEIMDGQAYDEKVDIFSFSMVIYEVLTGHPPFEKYSRLHQLHQVITSERCRPALMEYNVVSNFPYLESLMERMWAHDPKERPSASDILCQMKDVGFILQHSHLATSLNRQELRGRSGSNNSNICVEGRLFCNVTCVWALDEMSRASSALGRNICWVWESPSANSSDRRLCVYNLASGKPQTPSCKDIRGLPVTCMAQIGPHRWVGTKEKTMEIVDFHTHTTVERAKEVAQTHDWGCGDGGQQARVDIFPIRCMDSAKGRSKLDALEADPVAIIQDKNNPNRELLNAGSEGFVYIAMSDGTIQIYCHQSRKPTPSSMVRSIPLAEWRRHKPLTLNSPSVQAMCLIPSRKELVVGCGHSLTIISTHTLRVEQRVCPLTRLPTSARDKVGCIRAMVSNDHTLWCCYKSSALILEFDIRSWMAVRAYCIEADLEVYITEVTLRSKPSGPQEQECQECCGGTSMSRRFPTTVGSDGGCGSSGSSSPSPPPRPPSSTKPGLSSPARDSHSGSEKSPVVEEGASEPEVQMRPKRASPARDSHSGSEKSPVVEEGASEPEVQMRPKRASPANRNPGRSQTSGIHDHILSGTEFSEQTSTSLSVNPSSTNRKVSLYGEVFLEPPALPPRRPSSENASDGTAVAELPSVEERSRTLPNLRSCRTVPPSSPQSPSSPQRRSLPSEHDGVYVQSMLCVNDTLWVGSSCGEILVISIQETRPQQKGAGDSKQTQRDLLISSSRPRKSLSLEARQICNLVSVRMSADRSTSLDRRNRSGGVHTLVQARDLVVAVRNVSQVEEARDIAEITVWQACSAERFKSIRQYWQSIPALEDHD